MKTSKFNLFIDQYGQVFYARTLKELREKVSGSVSKMYRDDKSGNCYHSGYVIGSHWLTGYVLYRGKA